MNLHCTKNIKEKNETGNGSHLNINRHHLL